MSNPPSSTGQDSDSVITVPDINPLKDPVTTWTSSLGGERERKEIKAEHGVTQRNLKRVRAMEQFGNHLCNDCEYPDSSWTSVNNGIFLCAVCAIAHKTVENSEGANVTKVKGCSIDYYWGHDEIDHMLNAGNYRSEAQFGGRKIDHDASKQELVAFVIQKYKERAFAGEVSRDIGTLELPEDLATPPSSGIPSREACITTLEAYSDMEPSQLAEHVEAITWMLDHHSAVVRRTAMEVLSVLPDYADAISKNITDENMYVRWAAVVALSKLDPADLAKFAELFKERLTDEQKLVRQASVEALGMLEPPELAKHAGSVPPLLQDVVIGVRLSAIQTLGKLLPVDLNNYNDIVLQKVNDSEAVIRKQIPIMWRKFESVVPENQWTQEGFDFWETSKKEMAEKAGEAAVQEQLAADNAFDEDEVRDAAQAAALNMPFEQPAVGVEITEDQLVWLSEMEEYLYRTPDDIAKRLRKGKLAATKDVLSVHAKGVIELLADPDAGVRKEAVHILHTIVPHMMEDHINNFIKRLHTHDVNVDSDRRLHNLRGLQRFQVAQGLHLKFLELKRICGHWEDIDADRIAAGLMYWADGLFKAMEFVLTGIIFTDPDDRKPLNELLRYAEFEGDNKHFKETLDNYLRSIGRL